MKPVKQSIILSAGKIYTASTVLTNHAIIIQEKKIIDIIPNEKIKSYKNFQVCEFSKDYVIVPGFIDMHIHGSNGKDVMDASFVALKTISETLATQGTTAYLATTMTASAQQIENVLSHIRDYHKRQSEVNGAEVLGVHLEGPFISPEKVGAQRQDFLLPPDSHLLSQWQKVSGYLIKLVTLAPELKGAREFIQFLKQQNIIASIGHTNATFNETMSAIEAGCSHATHLFNAMRGMSHREPGTVGAILNAKKVLAELIVDGIHVHPIIVELTHKIKEKNLVLVSDAMRAQCLPDGEYELGGQMVAVQNGEARLPDGKLAGSTIKLIDALKLFMQFTKTSLEEAIQFTSFNPAKALGILDHKGNISVGTDADLVVLDKNLQITMTICAGRIVKP